MRRWEGWPSVGAPVARPGRGPLLRTTRSPDGSPRPLRADERAHHCRRSLLTPGFRTVAAPARGCLALPVSDALARRRHRPPHPRATVMTTKTIAAAKRGSCVCERGRRLAVGRVGVCGRVCGAKAVPRAAAIPPFPPARTFLLCLFAPRTIASDHRLRLATTKLLAVFGSTLIISLPPSTR